MSPALGPESALHHWCSSRVTHCSGPQVAGFFGNASTGPSLAKALQYVGANPHVLEALRQEQQVGPGGAGWLQGVPKAPTQRMPGCTGGIAKSVVIATLGRIGT